MPKYRKKPVIIEAIQWDASAETWNELQKLGMTDVEPGEMGKECFYINTLEGKMKCEKGDWVIKGVKGEFYPCKPDIFEQTYDKCDSFGVVESLHSVILTTFIKNYVNFL